MLEVGRDCVARIQDADGRLEMFGLNDKHRNCIVSYLHFARAQRSQHLKSIDACLTELKASRYATSHITLNDLFSIGLVTDYDKQSATITDLFDDADDAFFS